MIQNYDFQHSNSKTYRPHYPNIENIFIVPGNPFNKHKIYPTAFPALRLRLRHFKPKATNEALTSKRIIQTSRNWHYSILQYTIEFSRKVIIKIHERLNRDRSKKKTPNKHRPDKNWIPMLRESSSHPASIQAAVERDNPAGPLSGRFHLPACLAYDFAIPPRRISQ